MNNRDKELKRHRQIAGFMFIGLLIVLGITGIYQAYIIGGVWVCVLTGLLVFFGLKKLLNL